VQNLIDVRNQLDRYTSPERVEWHFASINSRWTKRALASAGFGYPTETHEVGESHRWKPIFSVAEIGGSSSAAEQAEWEQNREEIRRASVKHADIEHAATSNSSDDDLKKPEYARESGKKVVVHSVNKPLFHLDLTAALQSAVYNAEHRKKVVPRELVKEGSVGQ
jgi:sodium-independent sulfate anion transporter 11